jgi:hypothetical protein
MKISYGRKSLELGRQTAINSIAVSCTTESIPWYQVLTVINRNSNEEQTTLQALHRMVKKIYGTELENLDDMEIALLYVLIASPELPPGP